MVGGIFRIACQNIGDDVMGCAPGKDCEHCGDCGPLVSFSIQRAPGTCCPEPSCDTQVAPVKCEMCGATCPCAAWEASHKDRVVVDGKYTTEDELKLASLYMNRLALSGLKGADMIRWARKELADPNGRRPL